MILKIAFHISILNTYIKIFKIEIFRRHKIKNTLCIFKLLMTGTTAF